MMGVVVASSVLLLCWRFRSSRSEVVFRCSRGSRCFLDDAAAQGKLSTIWDDTCTVQLRRVHSVANLERVWHLQMVGPIPSNGSEVVFRCSRGGRCFIDGATAQGELSTIWDDTCTVQLRRTSSIADLEECGISNWSNPSPSSLLIRWQGAGIIGASIQGLFPIVYRSTSTGHFGCAFADMPSTWVGMFSARRSVQTRDWEGMLVGQSYVAIRG